LNIAWHEGDTLNIMLKARSSTGCRIVSPMRHLHSVTLRKHSQPHREYFILKAVSAGDWCPEVSVTCDDHREPLGRTSAYVHVRKTKGKGNSSKPLSTQMKETTLTTSKNESAVFISYSSGEHGEFVDQIDEAFQKRKIVRDVRDLDYKASVKEFIERIGHGVCVVVVISDEYLRSANCMFALVEISENKKFHDRVFPIVLEDANIYDPIKRIEYIRHWETKRVELAEAMKTLDPTGLQGIQGDLDLYDRIRNKVPLLTSILKDMNTLTPEIHSASGFSTLIDAVERRLQNGFAKTMS